MVRCVSDASKSKIVEIPNKRSLMRNAESLKPLALSFQH